MITTKETAFWRILSSSDTYDPDRLAFDRELLRRHYLNEGYADFRVVSVIAELLPNREGFIVTFTVEGAPPGEPVHYIFRVPGPGAGPAVGPLQLDLLNPIYYLGSINADRSGTAEMSLFVPANMPPFIVHSQAIAIRGPWG